MRAMAAVISCLFSCHHSLQANIPTKVCILPTSTPHSNGLCIGKPNSKHTFGFIRISQLRTSATCVFKLNASSTAAQETENSAEELVDSLLSMVEGTDRGAILSKEEHARVAGTVSKLEQFCIPEPLKSPLIFGDWDVEYCSNPTSTGGYYRSAIGRLLLKTKEMAQTIQAPDFVGNKVAFSALNAIDGEVSLKGKFIPMDNKWIQITFDSPYLKLGPFEFRYGGQSSVKIAVIYVDSKIRLGRGSRGSIFIFKRCG